VVRPAETNDHFIAAFLDFLFTVVALLDDHRSRVCDQLWIADRFQFFDSNCVILQLIIVPAELFSAGYIFVAMVFEFFQNRTQFRNDWIEFFIQLLVHLFLHKLINGFENSIGLIGQKFSTSSLCPAKSFSISFFVTDWRESLDWCLGAWKRG